VCHLLPIEGIPLNGLRECSLAHASSLKWHSEACGGQPRWSMPSIDQRFGHNATSTSSSSSWLMVVAHCRCGAICAASFVVVVVVVVVAHRRHGAWSYAVRHPAAHRCKLSYSAVAAGRKQSQPRQPGWLLKLAAVLHGSAPHPLTVTAACIWHSGHLAIPAPKAQQSTPSTPCCCHTPLQAELQPGSSRRQAHSRRQPARCQVPGMLHLYCPAHWPAESPRRPAQWPTCHCCTQSHGTAAPAPHVAAALCCSLGCSTMVAGHKHTQQQPAGCRMTAMLHPRCPAHRPPVTAPCIWHTAHVATPAPNAMEQHPQQPTVAATHHCKLSCSTVAASRKQFSTCKLEADIDSCAARLNARHLLAVPSVSGTPATLPYLHPKPQHSTRSNPCCCRTPLPAELQRRGSLLQAVSASASWRLTLTAMLHGSMPHQLAVTMPPIWHASHLAIPAPTTPQHSTATTPCCCRTPLPAELQHGGSRPQAHSRSGNLPAAKWQPCCTLTACRTGRLSHCGVRHGGHRAGPAKDMAQQPQHPMWLLHTVEA